MSGTRGGALVTVPPGLASWSSLASWSVATPPWFRSCLATPGATVCRPSGTRLVVGRYPPGSARASLHYTRGYCLPSLRDSAMVPGWGLNFRLGGRAFRADSASADLDPSARSSGNLYVQPSPGGTKDSSRGVERSATPGILRDRKRVPAGTVRKKHPPDEASVRNLADPDIAITNRIAVVLHGQRTFVGVLFVFADRVRTRPTSAAGQAGVVLDEHAVV